MSGDAVLERLAARRVTLSQLLREGEEWGARYGLWTVKALAADLAQDSRHAEYCTRMARRSYAQAEACHERRALLLGLVRETERSLAT